MSGVPGTKSADPKSPVNLSGTAKDAKDGPPLGLVDMGESQHAYIFRVSLPGVCKPQCNVKLHVHIDGRVDIDGVVQESEFLRDNDSSKYKYKLRELAPLGSFNISFNLPGRVDPRLVSPSFRNAGILEIIVMKHNTLRQVNNFSTPILVRQ